MAEPLPSEALDTIKAHIRVAHDLAGIDPSVLDSMTPEEIADAIAEIEAECWHARMVLQANGYEG